MDQELLRELNDNLKWLRTPKKECRTDEEKIKEYGERVARKYAKKNLKA